MSNTDQRPEPDLSTAGDIDEDLDKDIDDKIEQSVDRQAGYDNDAASEIQTSIAELQKSSEDIAEEVDDIRGRAAEQHEGMSQIAEEADDQTRQIADINRAVDELVADWQAQR